MKSNQLRRIVLKALLTACLAGVAWGTSGSEAKTMPFYLCHGDPRPGWPSTPEAIAEMVKGFGYDGMGSLSLGEALGELRAYDSVGLKLSQIYLNVDLSPDQRTEFNLGGAHYDPGLKKALRLLKGRDVQLVLMFYGLKPSKPATDQLAVHIVREIADLARDAGATVLLPNMDKFPPQISLDDMLALAEKVDRPNVGVMFSLFEWLIITPDRDYETLLKRAMPRLMAVGLSGADTISANTQDYVQPLGSGSFDTLGFLTTLRRLGYHGPVVLQSQNIIGDRKEILSKSIAAWQKYSKLLEETVPTKH